VQVALALVLLVSSGLLIRTFQNLRSVEPGFTDPATVQTVRLSRQGTGAAGIISLAAMSERIVERLAAIPGVTSAAYTGSLPMESSSNFIVAAEGVTYPADELPPGRRIRWISPGLLQTLGTPLLTGRDFEWAEIREQRDVVLVSESFARESWGSIDGAIGKRVDVGNDGSWQEVLGVVAELYDDGVDQPAPPIVYWPAREQALMTGLGTYLPSSVSFVLRTERAGTDGLLAEIRRAVAEVAPGLPLAAVGTLEQTYRNHPSIAVARSRSRCSALPGRRRCC
jgi:hypothetical protein